MVPLLCTWNTVDTMITQSCYQRQHLANFSANTITWVSVKENLAWYWIFLSIFHYCMFQGSGGYSLYIGFLLLIQNFKSADSFIWWNSVHMYIGASPIEVTVIRAEYCLCLITYAAIICSDFMVHRFSS